MDSSHSYQLLFKKENENTMVTQAWEQMPHYHGYVLDALTSAELRKLVVEVQIWRQLLQAERSVRT